MTNVKLKKDLEVMPTTYSELKVGDYFASDSRPNEILIKTDIDAVCVYSNKQENIGVGFYTPPDHKVRLIPNITISIQHVV